MDADESVVMARGKEGQGLGGDGGKSGGMGTSAIVSTIKMKNSHLFYLKMQKLLDTSQEIYINMYIYI